MGLDGELLASFDNLRKSAPAHLNVNMWVFNVFAEKDKPESLIKSIDVHNLDLKFEQYKHADQCVKIKSKTENKFLGKYTH